MNKMKRLLAALIIVTILALVCLVSGLIAKLLMLLPSPWCHIAVVSYLTVMLIGIIYVIIGEIEQDKITTLNLTKERMTREEAIDCSTRQRLYAQLLRM